MAPHIFLSTLLLLNLHRWLGVFNRRNKTTTTRHHNKSEQRLQYAILVDAENIPPNSLEYILQDLLANDTVDAPIRRVYGDFHKTTLAPWKATSLQLSFLPVHAFSYVNGKGTSDSALIIDAMELLYSTQTSTKTIDGFALVSSDSDFTRLAQRLREAGKHVVGYGSVKTLEPFCVACERFVYIEHLMNPDSAHKPQQSQQPQQQAQQLPQQQPQQPQLEPPTLDSGAVEFLYQIIDSQHDDPDGWVYCSYVGGVLQQSNQYSLPQLGYSKLMTLLEQNPQYFEVQLVGSTYKVRRPGFQPSATTTAASTKPTTTVAVKETTTSNTSNTNSVLPASVIQSFQQEIDKEKSDAEGWVDCSLLGKAISKADRKKHGYKKLVDLFRDQMTHFETRSGKKNRVFVRAARRTPTQTK